MSTDPSQTSGTSMVGRRMFGDYLIEKQLGEGGMGAVYLARHVTIGQKVAIKVLHPDSADSHELIQRFNREAKVIARLTHPNIIRVFIFGTTPEGLIFLAMEFVDGDTLSDWLDRHGKVSELRAILIVKQILGAVAEAHDLGIVHRDLKPDNVLLTEYRGTPGFVKILDFGIAKVQEPEDEKQQQLTKAGVVYGTPEYLSPEQAQAKPLDGRSDLYSIGVMLYELVTGRVPFEGNSAMAVLVQHVYDDPPEAVSINPELSPRMQMIIKRAMAKDPELRYRTAALFLDDLQTLEDELEDSGVRITGEVKTQIWMPPPEFLRELDMVGAKVTTPTGAVQQSAVAAEPRNTAIVAHQPETLEPETTSPAGWSGARIATVVVIVAGVVLLAALAVITAIIVGSK